ncbi:MAG: sugar ABC transporter permease, partial [Nitrospira sp.]|nr:sugar ABC transporter permease [Nitrospira sp.]
MNDRSLAEAKRQSRTMHLTERVWGYLLAGPAFILVALVALAPITAALWLSLRQQLPIFGIDEFVGLRNYAQLLGD